MSQVMAKLEITMTEDGIVSVSGWGTLLKNKAFSFGLLELAKEVLREENKSRILPGALGDMPRM